MSSSTPSSSSGNMACLPEEPELVSFGEDHEGLPPPASSTPQRTSVSGSYVILKRPSVGNNGTVQQRQISPDGTAHLSSSPSPPIMTASSASSAVSSAASSTMKNKPPTGNIKVAVVFTVYGIWNLRAPK